MMLWVAGVINAFAPHILQQCFLSERQDFRSAQITLWHLRDVLSMLDELLVAENPWVQQAVVTATTPECSHSQACSTCKLELQIGCVTGYVSVLLTTPEQAIGSSASPPEQQASLGRLVSQTTAAMYSKWAQPDRCWPTPTSAAWQDIGQLVARLIVLQTFLGSSCQPGSQLLTEQQQLRQSINVLLCKLLAGHVSNPEIDVLKVFKLAFAQMMIETCQDDALLGLGSLLMQRLVSDVRLLQGESTADPPPCLMTTQAFPHMWDILSKFFWPIRVPLQMHQHTAQLVHCFWPIRVTVQTH